MNKRVVVALGGNALIKPGQKGTIYEQFANTRATVASVVKMIQNKWEVVLTHGNGPQVGAILLQNEAGRKFVPPMPLGICVAESQGLIGYMIQQCLSNALRKAGLKKDVVTVITQVLVDKNDPAFTNPTKPIGPYYSDTQAFKLLKDGYQMMKQKQGWRIVVPSPDPKSIVEADIIRKLVENDVVVIAAGGGGLPVIEREGWGLDGREAVVDKDLAAERLGEAVNADTLLILTDVPCVYLYYGARDQKPLTNVGVDEIRKYYEDGHFPPGSMGPKVLAAMRFLEAGGKRVIIADIDHGWEALNEKIGTIIT
ncbi:MAG TPA: carbamate kinase [Thermoplasmata archaeon]|nr:carbamate kinase [Thermoplasmata archaeon]